MKLMLKSEWLKLDHDYTKICPFCFSDLQRALMMCDPNSERMECRGDFCRIKEKDPKYYINRKDVYYRIYLSNLNHLSFLYGNLKDNKTNIAAFDSSFKYLGQVEIDQFIPLDLSNPIKSAEEISERLLMLKEFS
jgi:hypothetical protein